MRVTIFGKRWQLLFGAAGLKPEEDGCCDAPTAKSKKIRVRGTLPPQRKLEVTIHEVLHAGDWERSEEWVTKVAEDLTRILWKLGYRKQEDLE